MGVNGRVTASSDFGFTDGSWATGHYTDIWLSTVSKGDATLNGRVVSNQYAIWFARGMWIMNNIYNHFAFNGNTTFLNEHYPLIEGAAKFALNYLFSVDGQAGELANYLAIGPTASPENSYIPNGN